MKIQQDCCGQSPVAKATSCINLQLGKPASAAWRRCLWLFPPLIQFFQGSSLLWIQRLWGSLLFSLVFIKDLPRTCSFLACINHSLVWIYIEVVCIKSVHLYSFQYPVRKINPYNGSSHSSYYSCPCSFLSRWTISLLHYHIKLMPL